MSSWPKEDRKIWEKSEIMSEFESRILKNVVKAAEHLKESGLKEVATTVKSVKQEADALNKSLQELDKTKQKLTNFSSDHLSDDLIQQNEISDCAMCGMSDDAKDDICDECYSKLDDSLAKDDLINSLKKVAEIATRKRDMRLVYQIERTIQEIEEND